MLHQLHLDSSGRWATRIATQGPDHADLEAVAFRPSRVRCLAAVGIRLGAGWIQEVAGQALGASGYFFAATIGTSNVAGATLLCFQSGKDRVILAIPLPASFGTRTEPKK